METPNLPAKETKLKRTITLKDLIFYGVGVILGAGIYALIGKGAGIAGNSLWLSFLLGASIASLTALSYAELSAMMPEAAGEYVYIKKTFKNKLLSFITIWLLIIVGAATSATVALGFSGYFNSIFGTLGIQLLEGPFFEITSLTLVALGLIAAFAFLIYKSMKQSAKLNMIFTIIEAAGLVLIIILGLMFVGQGNPVPDLVEMPNGFGGVIGAMALIFFAYLGFDEIVNMAEDTEEPEKNLPKALIWSMIITSVIYVLVAIAAVTVIPWDQLGESSAPLGDVATAVMGSQAGIVLSIIALFATANTVLIAMIATSRMIYGTSKHGAFPDFLSKISNKTSAPYYAILATFIVAGGFTIMNDIAAVAELCNFGLFLVFLMINISLIKLRYDYPDAERPFKSPVSIGKFPLLAGMGAIACFATLITYFLEFKKDEIIFSLDVSVIVSLVILGIGTAIYFLLNKK